jgi:hypothetical protein
MRTALLPYPGMRYTPSYRHEPYSVIPAIFKPESIGMHNEQATSGIPSIKQKKRRPIGRICIL